MVLQAILTSLRLQRQKRVSERFPSASADSIFGVELHWRSLDKSKYLSAHLARDLAEVGISLPLVVFPVLLLYASPRSLQSPPRAPCPSSQPSDRRRGRSLNAGRSPSGMALVA